MKHNPCDRIFNPAGHRHHTVVQKHVLVEWIESGIVNVSEKHALTQIVENHQTRTATQPAKGFLMQFGPGARTGMEKQQAYRFAL
jgi:hypothetical protein